MNGHEPLPGLLDDPQFSLLEFPALTDFQIPPLRNPAPTRSGFAPSPLEPLAKVLDQRHVSGDGSQHQLRLPRSGHNDGLQAQDGKKPYLAISALVDTEADTNLDAGREELQPLQLPSFVSLSVVEKSPIPQASQINSYKRPCPEPEVESAHLDVNRLLPRPAKKDDQKARPVPLLPAMVTGLHEPPPSAGLLPSMSESRPGEPKRAAKKMKVRDMLVEPRQLSNRRPPEAMLNSPDMTAADTLKPPGDLSLTADEGDKLAEMFSIEASKKVPKIRRVRRRWTKEETANLCAGVEKHGFGKWKQILADSAYKFDERTAVDLKDRFRVHTRDAAEAHPPPQERLTVSSTDLHTEAVEPGPPLPTPEITSIPSPSRSRRPRHPWTADEDRALVQGVVKHGFQWTAIHADPALTWGDRRATDLRDRIRTLYPEQYKRAGARPFRGEPSKTEADLGINISLGDTNHAHTVNAAKTQIKKHKERSKQAGNKSKKKPPTEAKARTNNLQGQERGGRSKSSGKTQPDELDNNNTSAQSTVHKTDEQFDRENEKDNKADKNGEKKDSAATTTTAAGVTLPSLDLDDDADLEWNNTLPPLLEWDDIGM